MSNLLSQASLVMIPSGYKEDVVYSPVPTDGSGDLTFTRASNGTRVNSAGLVEVCPWNLVSYSEEFNNTSGWTPDATNGSITITANYATAPNGTTTADRIQITKGTNYSQLYQTSSVISGAVYTISVYLKSLSGTPTITTLYDGTEKGTQTLTTDWVRYTFSFTATSSTVFPMIALYTGNSASIDILAWGYQLNIGSTAKPYFPTTDRLNVPRLTYQNGGGGCPSLLLEKQSTNLNLYSEDFSNAVYTLDGITVTANNTTSPDGTQNADKLVANAVSGDKFAYQVIATSIGSAYTASAYFKASEYTYAFMRLGAIIGDPYIIYNLATQAVVSTSSLTSYSITSMGNGWYRITATATATTTVVAPNFMLIPSSGYTLGGDNIPEFTGNGSNGGFIWGAQLEASSYATTYIPTTSSSATRVADVCVKSGISSLIGQTEGVAFVDFDFNGNYSGGGVIPLCLDGGGGNELYIWVQTSGVLLCEVANSGSVQASITGAIGALGRKKIAFAYKQNDFVVYLNGTQFGIDTSGTIPTMSRLYVGKYWANNTYDLNAGINQAVLFPTRLTNAELASLTTL